MRLIALDVDNKQDSDFKLHRPNGRADYLFVLFKSPSRVMVDGEYISADLGSFIIFDKHKIQSYYADGEAFLHDFVHFDTESDFEKLILSQIPTDTLLYTPIPAPLSSILSEIKGEFVSAPSEYTPEILTNLGIAFLYRIKKALPKSDATPAHGRYFAELNNLRHNIYKNPSLDWTVEKMTRELNLSRSYFQSLYKKLFTVSCTEDVISARIAYAKILLSSTLHPVGQIALECGYSNAEHFIRQFKSKTGVSPQKFRNS